MYNATFRNRTYALLFKVIQLATRIILILEVAEVDSMFVWEFLVGRSFFTKRPAKRRRAVIKSQLGRT